MVLQEHRQREHHLAIERPVGVHVERNSEEPAVGYVQLGNCQVIDAGVSLELGVHAAHSSYRKCQNDWQEATGRRSDLSGPEATRESRKARTGEGSCPGC